MKKLILILCLILLPTSLHAWGVVGMCGGTPAAGGGCATQTKNTSAEVDNGDAEVSSDTTLGQSFTTSAFGGGTKEIHRIILRIAAVTSGGTMTLRFDNDTDMSSEYTVQIQQAYTGTGEITFTFAEPRPTVSQSTVYYFFVQNSGNCTVDYDVDAAYAGGSLYFAWSQTWTPSIDVGTDAWFQVFLCD